MIKRLAKELKDIETNPPENMVIYEDEEDKLTWHATIFGPSDSPYEEGAFNILIKFPDVYPFKPPKLTFETQIYHPFIN